MQSMTLVSFGVFVCASIFCVCYFMQCMCWKSTSMLLIYLVRQDFMQRNALFPAVGPTCILECSQISYFLSQGPNSNDILNCDEVFTFHHLFACFLSPILSSKVLRAILPLILVVAFVGKSNFIWSDLQMCCLLFLLPPRIKVIDEKQKELLTDKRNQQKAKLT